jgi:hypothetical protein
MPLDDSDRIPVLSAVADSATSRSLPAILRRLVRPLPWLLLGWGLIGANPVRSGEIIEFDAKWEGDFIAVSANADLRAEAATAWGVLTDYDHLAEFIPDMVSSRIVSRSRDGMVVEYKGTFGFFFFRQPMRLLLDVVLDPPRRIVARSVSGDLRDLRGTYDITQLPQALHLSYTARFLPAISLPPFIGLAVVRHEMEKQFTAMVNEIDRRGALGAGKKRGEAER